MNKRLKNMLINAGLLLATIILFFGSMEFLLRITGIDAGHAVPPPIYRTSSDPRISYELKPNMREKAFREIVTTNGLGFRGPEMNPSKKTIAVLGDSITFGYGLKDTESMPAKLQSLLPNLNVLNTAVPGYNLQQEAATFRDKVAPLKPSVVVIVFYPNDLETMDPAVLYPDGNIRPAGQAVPSPCQPLASALLNAIPGHCWLDSHSAFFRVIRKFLIQKTNMQILNTQEAAARSNLFEEKIPEENLARYAHTLSELTQDLSAKRLFVIWPDRNLHFLLRPRLRALAESQGFTVLDLYEVFGNAPETLSWDTVHPSSKTANEAAQIIRDALEHYQLLP